MDSVDQSAVTMLTETTDERVDDTALVARSLGDPEAFAALFDRHGAAIFDALARIPGVEITEDEVDARGRRGVGLKGPRPPAATDIIDPETYEYLGFRSTLVRDEDGERVEQVSSIVSRAVVDGIGQRP